MRRAAVPVRSSRVFAQAQTRPFARTRLYDRLDAARTAPLTLVMGEAALGKSTLVRDYLALRGVPHRWVAASAEHATPAEFLRDFAAAFSEQRPAMVRSYGAAAAQLGRGETAAVVRWACEHLRGLNTTVVVDELHHVIGDASCAAFLSALVEADLPGLSWILVLRDASALPVPRWLASNRATLPLEGDDLRVRPSEIATAFALAGRPIDDASVLAYRRKTHGWPLALAIALDGNGQQTPFEPDAVYEYIVAAALGGCTDAEREAIIELALMAHFDDRTLAALRCEESFGERLARERLVFAVDETTYAFYEPIRARLSDELDRLPDRSRSSILDRAATALTRVDRWQSAFVLRMRAQDQLGLSAALAARGFRALDGGEIAIVARALDAISEPVLREYPVALAVKGALASLDGNLDVAEAWFSIAVENAVGAERRAVVIRYGMDLVRREREDVVALLEAETARSDTPPNADADAALWGLLGTAYVQAQRFDEARDAIRRAQAQLSNVADPDVRARVLHQSSYVALVSGDIDDAKALANRALARADESFLYDVSARALSVIFNVAMLYEDDVVAARSALDRLDEAGRKAGNAGLRLYAMLNAYAIEMDAGAIDALDRLDHELNLMEVMLTPMVAEALLPAQALRAAWDGEFTHALDMLESSAGKLDGDRAAYRWAEIALYAAASDQPETARAAIAACGDVLRELDRTQALALRARAYVGLAEMLLGADETAIVERLAEARADASGTVRIQALIDAVLLLAAAAGTGADGIIAFGDALDALEEHKLTGVARLIARLPSVLAEQRRTAMPATMREQAAS